MMGLFSKRKSKQADPATISNQKLGKTADSTSSNHFSRQNQQHQLSKTLPYPNKSVRFAAGVSDDEGGFVTDSELEINRSTRYGSLRARPTSSAAPNPAASKLNGRHTVFRSQSYDQGRSQSYSERQDRSQSYSERQQHIQPSVRPSGGSVNGRGSLWSSNGVSAYQNGTDDDYMSDSSTASSFTRGSRMRSSLPILKHVNTRPVGLVFLTYQNETKKTVLPAEIKNLDTIKAMFLRCFPQQLTPDLLNSPKRRLYILDRSSNKFFLLVHLQEVKDGTMLKLVDSDALTPSTVRRSRSAHATLNNESNYYSEPEFDLESTSSARGHYGNQRPPHRMSLTKETNIDEPINNSWSHPPMPSYNAPTTQPVYLNPISEGGDYPPMYYYPPIREPYSDWNINQAGIGAVTQNSNHMTSSSSHHLASSSQPMMNSGVTQGSYLPPQQLHKSTIHSTKKDSLSKHVPSSVNPLDLETTSASSGKADVTSRNRMAKMESQIANLTAWVQTTLTSSRPSSSTSDRLSEASYQSTSNRSSISGDSSSTPQPGVSVELQQKISSASEQVKDLKSEFKKLRRIHEAQSETIQDTIKDALSKIQNAVKNIPGANHSPLRSKRCNIDARLDSYRKDHTTVLNQISELEACVSELRGDVVSKHCHVNITEVEALALRLSKATRGATDIKTKFPHLVKDLKVISQSEVDSVIQQQDFISREPERIEDALRRCKAITNVLFTLKRLAAVDSHRTIVVPKLYTRPVDESMRKQLFQEIRTKQPNHSDRMKSIQNAETSLARRKNILMSKDILKFEKSLEMASKNLKDAEQLPNADTDTEKSIEKLVDQAKQYQHEHKLANGSSRHYGHRNGNVQSDSGVTVRSKSQRVEHSLSFIQNRDSIHWDAESDSDVDEPDDTSNKGFIDVTDSVSGSAVSVSGSAFTLVNNARNHNSNGSLTSPHHDTHHQRSPVDSKQSIPNGKVYISTDSNFTESRHEDLQQQCQKLQELQRHHRLTPTIQSTRAPTNTPVSTPTQLQNSLDRSITSTTSSRVSQTNGINGKPLIAPKPQIRSIRSLSASMTEKFSDVDREDSSTSSDESDCASPYLKEPKSTTV